MTEQTGAHKSTQEGNLEHTAEAMMSRCSHTMDYGFKCIYSASYPRAPCAFFNPIFSCFPSALRVFGRDECGSCHDYRNRRQMTVPVICDAVADFLSHTICVALDDSHTIGSDINACFEDSDHRN